MNKFSKYLTMVAAATLCSVSAHAYVINFAHVVPVDNSGKTSPVVGANNVPHGTVFVETFDTATGCGLNSPANFVSITGGSYALQTGSNSYGAMPAGDTTCYAFGPAPGDSVPDTVKLDFSGLLATLTPGSYLNYFGLYYGSIDGFNNISFFGANGLIAEVTGQSLINQFGGVTGNQFDDNTNIYVNIYFDPNEEFSSFTFTTNSIAFEMDNLAVGYNVRRQDVPEPASLALVGLGLLGLRASRRRKAV